MATLGLLLTLAAVAQEGTLAAAMAQAEARALAGHPAEAVGPLEAAIRADAGSGDDALGGAALRLLAGLELRTADYDAAHRHGLDAARRLDRAGETAQAADARNTAGLAELYAGRYPTAAALFDAAQAASLAAADWARHAEQLTNLGNAHYFQGQYDAAAHQYDQAAAIVAAQRSAPWAARRQRLVDTNRAALLQRLGRYREALAIYQRISGAASPLPPEEQGQVRVNQGALYRRLGDPYKALDAYADAGRLSEQGRSAPGTLAALINRGIVLALDLNRTSAAVPEFTAAAELAARIGSRREEALAVLYRAEASRRGGELAQAGADFARAGALLDGLAAPDDAWKVWLGLGRVRAESGDTAGAATAVDRALAIVESLREQLTMPSSRVGFFQDKREVYDVRIAAAVDSGDVAGALALMERSRARGWRDQMGLPAAVTLTGFQQALAPGVVALVYWQSSEGAAVVRLTSSTATVHRLAVSAAAVADAISAAADRRPDAEAALSRLAGQLLPGGVTDVGRELVVVPDGVLAGVPFDALMLDGRPLVDRTAVRLLPALSMLARPAPRRSWQPPWAFTLAAFGDPVAGADRDQVRLPASAAEVAALDRTLGGRHALGVGSANRKSGLLAALQQHPQIVHLATHAVVDPGVAERSRLLFSPMAAGGAAESLYLREVYALPLTGTELAVLSACDTERGPLVPGEGVQGFGRALLAAGASSAVTTLWRVPDASAARVMSVFYEHLQAGVGRAEALALAKRAVRAASGTAHPHEWAAFVLTGDGAPLPWTPRWQSIAGGTLVAVGLAIGVAAWRPGRSPERERRRRR